MHQGVRPPTFVVESPTFCLRPKARHCTLHHVNPLNEHHQGTTWRWGSIIITNRQTLEHRHSSLWNARMSNAKHVGNECRNRELGKEVRQKDKHLVRHPPRARPHRGQRGRCRHQQCVSNFLHHKDCCLSPQTMVDRERTGVLRSGEELNIRRM